MQFTSKLPQSQTNIFSIMSGLARKHKAVNLGQGFPDFECDINLRKRLNKYLNQGKNQYAPMPGVPELRAAISAKINRSYQTSVDPDTQICVTAGATQALFTAITAFVHSGDEVIVIEPAFDSYIPAIKIAGGIPVIYAMQYPSYNIDWEQFASLITDRTRMILINTPHNPSATVLEEEDLQQLERIVAGKDIVVLSDEVYEHLIYDGASHQSVLRFPNLFQQSIAVFSFGKTFHVTGWKIGYCVGAAHLINEFKNIHQWNVFSVNSFIQYALAEHLQDASTYENLPHFFQQKRDFLSQELAKTPLKAKLSEGTYFQLYNYEALSETDDLSFSKYLTKEIGVAAIPMSPFYTDPPKDKVIRLCFAKKESTLAAAAERLAKLK